LVELKKDAKECKNIRITDFGLSKMMAHEGKHYDMCGTFAYVAPEILM
jgi:serine/threonine protein kinase